MKYKASGLLLFAELSQVNDIRPGEKPKEGKLDSILARYSTKQVSFREIIVQHTTVTITIKCSLSQIKTKFNLSGYSRWFECGMLLTSRKTTKTRTSA